MKRARLCGLVLSIPLMIACALALACGPRIGSTAAGGGGSQAKPESMPEELLDKSDPRVDTSSNPSTSHGGCGSWLNPCPDVLNPEGRWPFAGGCLGCSPGGAGGEGAPLSAVLLALALVGLRRRRA